VSSLAQEVAARVGSDEQTIDRVLAAHGIDVAGSSPTPSRLVVRRLAFDGVKHLTGYHPDGTPIEGDIDPKDFEEVPFRFDWELGPGLYGVASDENLRGKSSILKLIMWALRGRSGLRQDVAEWLRRVDCAFDIDADKFAVGFDVVEGTPSGTLARRSTNGPKPIGSFHGTDEFESLMGRTMLEELRLPVIPAAVEGVRTHHSWPAYSGAFFIGGKHLDVIVGDTKFGVPSRLLSMFVGSEWAAVRAQAKTALTIAEEELKGLRAQASAVATAQTQAWEAASAEAGSIRSRLEALPAQAVTSEDLDRALTELVAVEADIDQLQPQIDVARGRLHDAERELRDRRLERQIGTESAVAVHFFQRMRPTQCPRCAAPVTDERRDAEAEGDNCSVCTSELDIAGLDHGQIVAVEAAEAERAVLDEDDDDDAADEIEALTQVVDSERRRVEVLTADRTRLVARRAGATAVIDTSRQEQARARVRHQIELDLARAEALADARQPVTAAATGSTLEVVESLESTIAILAATEKIVAKRVTDAQQLPLDDLSVDITRLARSFGMAALTGVELSGRPTMKVQTGGASQNYGEVERGEQLRLKVATAIALIRLGRSTGIGRHPGLLLVDSLGAEEIPDSDLNMMLEALQTTAAEDELQIFIASRHTDILEAQVGADRCILGRGFDFVW
jgi:hypothetical protein